MDISRSNMRNYKKNLCGDLQNFLGKFVRFLVTLGLKILRLLRLKVVFEEDIIKCKLNGDVNYCKYNTLPILYE